MFVSVAALYVQYIIGCKRDQERCHVADILILLHEINAAEAHSSVTFKAGSCRIIESYSPDCANNMHENGRVTLGRVSPTTRADISSTSVGPCARVVLSLNSTGPIRTWTPTRTSSPTSARGFSRGRQSACPARAARQSACRGARDCRGARGPFSSPTCPRTFVRQALFLARMSVGDAHVYTCTCTVHDKLSCTRLQNYTIGTSLKSMSVSVSVSVSVPWKCELERPLLCTERL